MTTTVKPTGWVVPTLVPPVDFIADTLNEDNTGADMGTSFTTLNGSRTYTSSVDDTTISDTKFVGRVTLSGTTNLTFENCWFTLTASDADGYTLVSAGRANGNTNVQFNNCTFEGPASPVVDCTCFLNAYSCNWYRCHFTNFDNAIRMESDCLVDQCLFNDPSQLEDAHVDGIEMYAQSGSESNMEIRDSAFYIGPPNELVTCCINCTSDYGDNDGIIIERNLLQGGAFCAYLRDHPSTEGVYVPTNIEFIDNRLSGSNAGTPHVTVRLTDVGTLKYWSGNTDENGDTILIPGLGIERPRP